LEDGTMLKGLGDLETDPEKVDVLTHLWIRYQQELGGPVFVAR
jgi:hypothetical protein